MYFLYFVLCRTVYLVNDEMKSIVIQSLGFFPLLSLEVPPSDVFRFKKLRNKLERFSKSWREFWKEIGTAVGAGGISPLFQRDLNIILLKSILEPFSVCSLTRSAWQVRPGGREVSPTEHPPEKSCKPACSQAEGTASTAWLREPKRSQGFSQSLQQVPRNPWQH